MPNELKKFLKSFCLISIIIFVAFVALNLKGIDGHYDKLFSAIGSFGSLLIAYETYRISKRQEKRKLIKEHYQKTLEAIAKASYLWKKSGKEDENRFEEAIYEIFESRKSAKIELNDDFADLIEKIYNFYLDLLNQHMDAVKEKRALGGEKFLENHNKESALRKELENLYAKYLSIPKL